MKLLIAFSLFFCLITAAVGEQYLQDVPRGHWAYSSVYELIRLGVTNGYPDGTYQGSRPITRYEMAAFLSKLAKSFHHRRNVSEKLLQELRTELNLIKFEREKSERVTKIHGQFSTRLAKVLSYRLQIGATKQLLPEGTLTINLDTMDAGLDQASNRRLTTELFDAEAVFSHLRLVLGPGDVLHRDDSGLVPAEDRQVYRRPNSKVDLFTHIKGLDLGVTYQPREQATTGRLNQHEIDAYAKFGFLQIQPRYFHGQETLVEIELWPKEASGLLVGIGEARDQSSLYVQARLDWGWGYLRADRVGSRYRNSVIENELYLLDNFNRPILDGRFNLGWGFKKELRRGLFFEEKGNLSTSSDYKYGADYAGSHYTEQLNLSAYPHNRVKLSLFYQSFFVPSGLNEYNETVENNSTLYGLSISADI
ncbi:MAG: S-layer homology domain-containing protein [bacterium]